jgi:hypothetical protein
MILRVPWFPGLLENQFLNTRNPLLPTSGLADWDGKWENPTIPVKTTWEFLLVLKSTSSLHVNV